MILQAKTTEARRVTGNEDAALAIVPVELGERLCGTAVIEFSGEPAVDMVKSVLSLREEMAVARTSCLGIA